MEKILKEFKNLEADKEDQKSKYKLECELE